MTTQNLWDLSSSKREVYSNTILPLETRKTPSRQPNFTPKTTGKRTTTTNTTKISRRKGIIQIWTEINEKETKETVVKINKTEILSSIFSDHNAMRLDINYKKKTVRNTNTGRLNNAFLNQQATEELR